jgi:hypothetical protein
MQVVGEFLFREAYGAHHLSNLKLIIYIIYNMYIYKIYMWHSSILLHNSLQCLSSRLSSRDHRASGTTVFSVPLVLLPLPSPLCIFLPSTWTQVYVYVVNDAM